MDTWMQLHTFLSAKGDGRCDYEELGVTCGGGPGHAHHLAATPNPVDRPHPFVPDLSNITPGCQKERGGKWCNRTNLARIHKVTPPDPVGVYLEEKADMAHTTYHGGSFPVDDPPTTAQVVALFHDQALRLAVAKDQAYRKAWVDQGYIGNVGRILSKVSRLRNMVWRDQPNDLPPEVAAPTEQEEETLRDTLLDLANLCAFAAHNLARGNRWGEGK